MNTTECIDYVRSQASIAVDSTEWSSAVILQLLNQTRVDIFEPIIAEARCGYWTRTLTRTLGANNPVVRLPTRACAVLLVDIRRANDRWYPLQEFTEAEQQAWEREGGNYPKAFIIRGTSMYLIPAPVDDQYSIRIKIIVRPSKLYLPQAAGVVTNVDLSTNIITLTSLPVDKVTGLTITGTLNVDIIEPADNFELSLFHAQATVIDATHVQIGTGYSLLAVQNNDYLRVANQTDWPQLPEPFHHVLASAAAIVPCTQRDLYDRVEALQQSVSSTVTRLVTALKPRIKVQTQERRPVQHSWE